MKNRGKNKFHKRAKPVAGSDALGNEVTLYPSLRRKHKKNKARALQSKHDHAERKANKFRIQAAHAAYVAANQEKWAAARAAKLAKDIADHTTVKTQMAEAA